MRTSMRELADVVGVSEPTLIRFSRHFGFSGFPELRLAVAMAFAAQDASISERLEPSLTDKADVNSPIKKAIAEKAVETLPESGSILLDSGSTILGMIDALRQHSGLTILTTGIPIFQALSAMPQHQLILPGGFYRSEAKSIGGRIAEAALATLSFDTAFIGADSIHPKIGLSTFSEEEASLTRAMIRSARKCVVLADASKFQASALHLIANLSSVDTIVSDDRLNDGIQTAIRMQGPELVLAQTPASTAP